MRKNFHKSGWTELGWSSNPGSIQGSSGPAPSSRTHPIRTLGSLTSLSSPITWSLGSLGVCEGQRFKTLVSIDLTETWPLQNPCHRGALGARRLIVLDNLLLFWGLFSLVRGFNYISLSARLNRLSGWRCTSGRFVFWEVCFPLIKKSGEVGGRSESEREKKMRFYWKQSG